jgi:hypothetical protein
VRIFISYSRIDRPSRETLGQFLLQYGYEIQGESERRVALPFASTRIAQCDIVICLISQSYKNSPDTEPEWQYALQAQKWIVPILLENKALPKGFPAYKYFELRQLIEQAGEDFYKYLQWLARSKHFRLNLLASLQENTHEGASPVADLPSASTILEMPRCYPAAEASSKIPRQVHLITGGQGSAGKTILILSLAWNYLEIQKQEALLVDINPRAQNLFQLLTNPRAIYPAPHPWQCTGILNHTYGKIVTCPTAPDINSRDLGHYLQTLVDFPDYTEGPIIVDTHLPFTHLQESVQGKLILDQWMGAIQPMQIYIWYIWTRDTVATTLDYTEPSVPPFGLHLNQETSHFIATAQAIDMTTVTAVHPHCSTQDKPSTLWVVNAYIPPPYPILKTPHLDQFTAQVVALQKDLSHFLEG